MKKLLFVTLSLMLMVTLSACGKEDSVKMGVVGPLTGDYAMYGIAVENGAKLAAEEINASGGVLGKNLDIIAYDSQGDPTQGVNAYNRLRDQDEIDALIGGTFSGETLAIKELAVQDGIPILTPTATNPDVTKDADNVFRACYTDSLQGMVVGKFASENLGLKKVAVLYNRDDAYSQGLADAFMTQFYGSGLDDEANNSFVYEFGANDDDYSAVLTNIMDGVENGDYDGVFLPGYISEVGAILTQADSMGLDVPFVGGDGWDGLEAEYADVAEGDYFVNHYAKTDSAQIVQDFVTNYTAKYGDAPSALAALAYDAVYTMAAAMDKAGSTNYSDVITALASIEYTGVTGTIRFDAQGDPIKTITAIQIVDGEHVVVAKINPEDE